ncbi:DNA polymerase epsilon catalytic subunit [Gracilaria domingensis]|nr:DNA polymerase epsilon catalytic subunit [Gracilaria domingensis]
MSTNALFGSSGKKVDLRKKLSALQECIAATRSYPLIRVPNNAEDGNYLPVGWEPRATTTALSRCGHITDWLPNQLLLSRFPGIPIGNMSLTDVHAQALDVLFGPELINLDHILWASTSSQPDLGGLEEDDCNLQNEIRSVPEVTNPGSYHTICIDTELSNLSIVTILSSSYVNQVEGTDLAFDAAADASAKAVRTAASSSSGPSTASSRNDETFGRKRVASLDEMASFAPAFNVLKDLVRNWDKIASQESNGEIASLARNLLDHLNSWTRSESSLLFDSTLSRFLGWLVKNVFRQLIGELKNLGASVVYASSSRLIFATPKTHTFDGLRYAGFLEKTINEKHLFRHIRFHPVIGVYAVLLLVDRLNYGALPAPEESTILTGEVTETQRANSNRQHTYAIQNIPFARMEWDFSRYLRIPIAVLWSQVVEEFIRCPIIQRCVSEEAEYVEEVEDNTTGSDENDSGADAEKKHKKKLRLRPRGDGFAEEVKWFVRGLTTQLLEKVHEMRQKTPSLVLPQVPSALSSVQEDKRNPALEFVRSLSHVLSLDSSSTKEMADM